MRTRSAFVLLMFAQFITSVDYNIVYVALPDIGRDLGFSEQSLQWVVSAYAVGFGGFLLLGGRAVDRLGPRRMFILGLALFGLSSLTGGLAGAPGLLITARAVQGLGAALLFPATLALINTRFEEGPERNRAMALWGVAGASGALVGPLAGGLLTNYLGWEWVFFVNVPLTFAAAYAAPRLLRADVAGTAKSFDVPGAVIVTGGSTLVVLGLVSGPDTGWGSPRAAGSIAFGATLVGLFLLVEKRTRAPLAPLRMFSNRGLATAIAVVFIAQGTINAFHYIFFIHLQNILGYSALQAGLAFLPLSLFAVVGSGRVLPALLSRWGIRTTLFVTTLGTAFSIGALAAVMSTDASYWPLLPVGAGLGLFAGMAYPTIFAAAGSGVSPSEQGVAAGLASTSAQIGGAVGLAALIAVAHSGPQTSQLDVLNGLRTAELVAGVVTVLAALAALLLRKPQRAAEPGVEAGVPAGV